VAERFHFIGICGTAMATLAAMLQARGHYVQGSDRGIYPPMSDFLAREGIRAFDEYRPEHLTPDIDVVVVGNAISRGNPELEHVLDEKIRFVSLPEVLRDRFLWTSRSIVIAGTHGKTSTTAMTGWLLTSGGCDPSVLVGGIARNFDSSYRLGAGRDFVIEGDEYDSAFFDKTAKFLKYLPDVAVIGNLEYDHADIYPDMASLRTAFRRFIQLVPRRGRILIGADSDEAMQLARGAATTVETFGLAEGADWRATRIVPGGGRLRFDVAHEGRPLGEFALAMAGEHNVKNALAALAVGHGLGLSADQLREGLASFRGVSRRLELRGAARGVSVFDDFAHHPTAIRETLQAVRASYPDRRIWGIFEPRSATSCRRIFQDDFARAFVESGADEIVLAEVFRTSLPDEDRLSVEDLVRDIGRAGGRARYLPTVDAIVTTVAREARDGDLVVIMSNGGFGGIHDRLLAALGGQEAGSGHAVR
jgi:UDP-N-acetylmuramate: L-alanyl-gamma-D-glutamyl-meso-diaminopimelate ligase